jgi:hypothetical protein
MNGKNDQAKIMIIITTAPDGRDADIKLHGSADVSSLDEYRL